MAQHRRKTAYRQAMTWLTVFTMLIALFPFPAAQSYAAYGITLSKSIFTVGYVETWVTVTAGDDVSFDQDARVALFDGNGAAVDVLRNVEVVDIKQLRFKLLPGLFEGKYKLLISSYQSAIADIQVLSSYDPTSVTITPGVDRDIRLTWTDPSALNLREIVIKYAPINQQYYPEVGTSVPIGKQSYTLPNLEVGKSYKISIQARYNTVTQPSMPLEFTNGGNGYRVTDTTPPRDITNLNVQAVNNGFDLTWTDPDDPDLKFITVQYAEHGTTSWSEGYTVAKGGQRAYLKEMNTSKRYDLRFTKIDNYGNFSYQIDTHNGYGWTFDTENTANVTSLSVSTGSDKTAVAAWSDPNSNDFHHVNLYLQGSDMTQWKQIGRADKGVQRYALSGLAPNINYRLRAVAVDKYGNEASGATAYFSLPAVSLNWLTNKLKIVQEPDDGLQMRWEDDTITTVDFSIFKAYYAPRGTDSDDEYKPVELTNRSAKTASIRNLPSGTYYLQLRLYDRYGIEKVVTTLTNGGDGYYMSGYKAGIPAEVGNVRIQPAGGQDMLITWNSASSIGTHVEIYKAKRADAPLWELVGKTTNSAQRFTVPYLRDDLQYFFKLVVRDEGKGTVSPGRIYDNSGYGYTLSGDTQPPHEVTNAAAGVAQNILTVSYSEPTDYDFESVTIYAQRIGTDSVTRTTAARGSNGTALRDLQSGTYNLRITTVDVFGNESAGVTLNNFGAGYTVTGSAVSQNRSEVRNPILIPGTNRLTVRFSDPLDPDYRRAVISIKKYGEYTFKETKSVNKGDNEEIFYNLEPNSLYQVRIATVNASGKESVGLYLGGDKGISLIPVGKVTDVRVTPGMNRLAVSWNVPSNAAPTAVMIEVRPNSTSDWSEPIIASPESGKIIVHGLENNKSYRLRLTTVQKEAGTSEEVAVNGSSTFTPQEVSVQATPSVIQAHSSDSMTLNIHGTNTHFTTNSTQTSVKMYDASGSDMTGVLSNLSANSHNRLSLTLKRALQPGVYKLVVATQQDGLLTTYLKVQSDSLISAPTLTAAGVKSVNANYSAFTMRLTGTGFTSATTASIDGGSAIDTSETDGQSLTFTVPANLQPGLHKITVKNGTHASNAIAFTVHPLTADISLTKPTLRTGAYKAELSLTNLERNGRYGKVIVLIRRNGEVVEHKEYTQQLDSYSTKKITIDFGGNNTPYAEGPTKSISLQAFLMDGYTSTPLGEPILETYELDL